MTTLHSAILSADCHEPKHITDSTTADAGKVLTPDYFIPATSILRQLNINETNRASFNTGSQIGVSIAVGASGYTVANFLAPSTSSIINPSGAPSDGQELIIRLIWDATGVFTWTWPSAFRFPGGTPPTLTMVSGKTDTIYFVYNIQAAKWDFSRSILNI